MALDKPTLIASIAQAFVDQSTKTTDQEAAISDLSNKIADAVDVYVRSGLVSTVLTVSGATGTGTGSIS
jgi:hypothetical protein